MVAIFSNAKGGPGVGWPDICMIPDPTNTPGGKLVLTPYPDGTLISVSKIESTRKVYRVKSGSAKELPIQDVETAPTFILLDDGSVSVYERECRTSDAAKRAVASVIGANSSAIIISIGDDEEPPLAFYVTPRSTRSLHVPARRLP